MNAHESRIVTPASAMCAGRRLEKLPHALQHLILLVERVEGAGARQRVAREEALVEDLAAAEGAARDVPGQAEELHAIARAARIRRQVLLDVRGQRRPEVG